MIGYRARLVAFSCLVSTSIVGCLQPDDTESSGVSTGEVAAEATTSPVHYADADNLVTALLSSSLNTNVYNTTGSLTNRIDWVGSPRTAISTCASFMTMLLKHSYGLTDAQFTTRLGNLSPSPPQYYQGIVNQSGFTRITSVSQLVAGDVVGIRYPTGSSPTGHVMMVTSVGALQLRSKSTQTFLATEPTIYGFYDVTVLDSSSTYHGSTDTRYTKPGGVGRGGKYRVFVDSKLRVLGYTWSTSGNDYKRESSGFNQAFGRINLAGW